MAGGVNWDSQTEREFWRHKCRDSLYWFFRIAWGYDFNPLGGAGPRNWFRDSTHRAAVDWLEFHIKEWLAWRRAGVSKTKKLAFVVAREFGKSTFVTRCVPAWMLINEPELAITIDSENDKKARMLMGPIAAVLSGEDKFSQFANLYGNWRSPSQLRQWTKTAVDILLKKNLSRAEPSLGTCGVEAGITMQHPDVFILDDPTSYEKLRADSNWKEVVNEHVESMIPVFGEGTLWLWPGTRYGDDDQYGTFLKSEGVASVTGTDFPDCDITPDGEWHVFYLPGITAGDELTMPHIWSRKRIKNWAARNPTKCASQVYLDPFQADINPLTAEQAARCYVEDDEHIPWRMTDATMHCDLAFKRPDRMGKGDKTGFVTWCHMRDASGEIILWGAWGSNRWQGKDLANRVVIEYQELKRLGIPVRCITCEQEAGGAQGLWQNHLQNVFAEANLVMPRFEYLRRAGKYQDKQERLIQAANFWRDLKVKIPRGRPGSAELVSQMCRIMGNKGKDYADAGADVWNPAVYRARRVQDSGEIIPPPENPFDSLLKGNLDTTEWWAGQVEEMEARSDFGEW